MWAQRMFRLSKGVTAGAAISMQLNSSAAVDCDDWKEHLVAAGTVIAGGALGATLHLLRPLVLTCSLMTRSLLINTGPNYCLSCCY